MTNEIDARMHEAIEFGLWQQLADALNDLCDHNIDVIAGFYEQHGIDWSPVLDAGAHHGGGVRDGGHQLRYVPPFTPDPDQPGSDLPFGWQVEARTT
ncbi:hypothetical protein [Streptomyces lydicamycinicus]|uniref:hypothetical protein n=1 Tax=Streptomyces lydicamycinicus TaxID=1546107 RepID=UPI003C2E548D